MTNSYRASPVPVDPHLAETAYLKLSIEDQILIEKMIKRITSLCPNVTPASAMALIAGLGVFLVTNRHLSTEDGRVREDKPDLRRSRVG